MATDGIFLFPVHMNIKKKGILFNGYAFCLLHPINKLLRVE